MNVEKDFREHWRPILEAHGVDHKEVLEYIKVLLHEYLFLQKQALAVYKAVTNGEMDRLTWCSGPIIEKFQELHQNPICPGCGKPRNFFGPTGQMGPGPCPNGKTLEPT